METNGTLQVLKNLSDFIIEVRRDGIVKDIWMKHPEHRPELSPEKTVGKYLRDIQPGTLSDETMLKINKALETGENQHIVFSTYRGDTPIKRGITILPLHEDEDAVYLMIEDYTERFKSEIIEDKWKLALDAAGDGMWDSNLLSSTMTFSDKWHEMFGYSKEDLASTEGGWGSKIHPDDLLKAQKNYEDYINGTKPIYSAQFRYLCKDGSYKWVLSRGVILTRTEDGTPWRMIGTHKDIHEQKLVEESLGHALEKEKELNDLKSKFVSIASHEFRTPLATILSSAYLASKYTGVDDQPKRDKHIERVISSVNLLNNILNDFLSVGKIEEGKLEVRYQQLDIEEMVNSVIEEVHSIQKKGQHINYKHKGDKMVLLDPSLLRLLLINLVSNAIKFSPEDGEINIYTSVQKDKVTVSVKDNGIGISEEDQRNLFERFFRGGNAGNIQGTGLGLHIVSKYAEAMNGTVRCVSELKKGTEFIIEFNARS